MSNETGSNTSGVAQSNVKQTSVDVSQLSSVTDTLASNAEKLGSAIQHVSAAMAAHNANLQTLVNSVAKIQQQTSAMMSLASAEDKVAAKGKEFVESLKQQAETLKMSKQEMLQYQAAQLGVSAQAAPFIEQLGHTEKGMSKLNFSSLETRKQLAGMAADVAQGNWDKMGGGLMGLAESTGALELALTSISGPVAIVAAVLGTIALAAVAGAKETSEFNKQMAMTGDFAGVTKEQFDSMAESISNSSNVGIGTAKEVMQGLIATGKFTGDSIEQVTKTAIDFSAQTGQSSEDVIKDFSKMADGVGDWAAEHNKQYHFLTAAQYEQIRALEEQGNTSAAVKIAMQALDEHIPNQVANLGTMGKAWLSLKKQASEFWDVLKGIGREETPDEKIKKLDKIIEGGGRSIKFDDPRRFVSLPVQDNSAVEQAKAEKENILELKRIDRASKTRDSEFQQAQATAMKFIDSEKKWADAHLSNKEKAQKMLDDYDAGQKAKRLAGNLQVDDENARKKRIQQINEDVYGKEKKGPDANQLAEERIARETRLRDIVNKGVNDDIETARKLGNISQVEYEQKMQQIALENIAYKKMQEEKVLALGGLTASQRLQHENNIKALDEERKVTEKAYENKALLDERKQRDDIIKSIVAEGTATSAKLTDAITKQQQQNLELEKTLGLKTQDKKITEVTSLAELEFKAQLIQFAIDEGKAEGVNHDINEAKLAQVREEIRLQKSLKDEQAKGLDLAARVKVQKANAEIAKKAEEAWDASSKSIGEFLASAIDNGGGSAVKKLIADMKKQFANMLLKPIIAPITTGIASFLVPNAAQAQDGSSNTFASLSNLLNAGKAIWENLGTNFATIGNKVSSFVQQGINALQGTSSAAGVAANGPIASMAGTAASYAGGIAAGVYGGRAISGGYDIAGHGNALVNIGTAIGSIWGPAGAAIGGMIAGLANRTFGMGEKQISGQDVTGKFSSDGIANASRNVSWTQKGGFFRSDRSGSWNYNLSNSTAIADGVAYQDTASLKSDQAIKKALEEGYSALKTSTEGYAKALGLNADQIKARTDEIKFSIGKDQAETAANFEKMLTAIADSMANSLMPELSKFTQGTETSSATLARLAIDLSGTNEMFGKLGLKLFDLNEAGITSAEKLLTAAGGLQNLQQITSSYYDNFFSASEKEADVRKALTAEFEKAGLGVLPKTRDGFRDMVTEISKTGTPEQIATLLKLSGAFASIVPAVVPVTEAVAAINDGVQKLNISTVFATTSNYMSIEDRLIEVKKRRAQEEELAAAAAASAQAMTELITAAQASIPALLRSGNVVAALAANMVGVFNDKTFSNDAAARFNAKASVKMAGQVSADALNTQDAGKVIGILLSQTLSDDFNESLATEVKNGLGVSMGNALSDALHGVFVTAGKMLALRDFAPQGPGIASVIAARNQFAFDSDAKTYRVANKTDESITYYGKDIQAYKDGIESLNYALKTGRITQDEYASGMVIIDTVMKDAKELAGDLGAQLRRVGEDAQRLAFSGMSSIGYYFGEISKAADALAVSAAAANTPLYQTETAIGRLTSLATVMGQSVSAVVDGLDAQIGSISKQMLLTQDEGQQRTLAGQLKSLQFDQAHIADPGSMVGNAAVIAQAASAAAAAMTTQDAKNAAAALSGNAAFSGVGGNQLRDMSLLLDGIKQLDPASFEAAFTRLNDALIKGRVNTAQYQALFEHGLDVFNNGAKEMVSAAQKMADVINGLKQKADEAMTALAASVNAEKNAAKTVYDDKVKQINAEKTAAVAIYDASTKAINGQIASVNKTVETTRTIVSTLTSALEGMRMSSNLAADRKTAQSFLSNAVSTAQNGGGLPEDDKLKSALGVISQPSTDLFSSFEDYTRDFYVTAGDIAALNAVATPQLDAAQQSLITLNAQLDQAKIAQEQLLAELEKNATDAQLAYTIQTDYLDGLLTNAKAQLDTALGTNVAVLTLSAAMLQVTTSITALASAQAAQAAAQMAAAQATAAATAQAAAQAKPAVLTGNVAAFATGGDTEGGLHLVGENGPELQLTGPSRIFTAAQTASMISGSASDELLSEIRKLRSAVENQDTAMNKIVSNTGATASSSAKTADAFGAGPVLVEIA